MAYAWERDPGTLFVFRAKGHIGNGYVNHFAIIIDAARAKLITRKDDRIENVSIGPIPDEKLLAEQEGIPLITIPDDVRSVYNNTLRELGVSWPLRQPLGIELALGSIK